MISVPLRAVCAFAAIFLFLGGVSGLVMLSSPWFLGAIVAAAFFVVPAMFAGRKPTSIDLPRIDENLRRFRDAMFLCFIGAAFFYGLVVSGRGDQQLAALGISLWLVAFTLMFFAAYYRKQRRMAIQSARDAG